MSGRVIAWGETDAARTEARHATVAWAKIMRPAPSQRRLNDIAAGALAPQQKGGAS